MMGFKIATQISVLLPLLLLEITLKSLSPAPSLCYNGQPSMKNHQNGPKQEFKVYLV
jgi:hypothetical protein